MSTTPRTYASKRSNIVEALATKLKDIDGSGAFLTDVSNNVHPRLKFWDEVEDFPAIHLNAGSETRQYQGAGYKDRFLGVTIRCYVNADDAQQELNALMEDVETVIEENGQLAYTDRQGNSQKTLDILIVSIETDEGVLEPFGVAEMLIQVHY